MDNHTHKPSDKSHGHSHSHDEHKHDHDHKHDHAHDHGHSSKHSHSHDHGHGHGHHHHTPSGGLPFIVGISLNLIFVIAEVIYGMASHSVALVADATHNAGDVVGLALAWGAIILAKRAPSDRRTYGLRRSTILASLGNAVFLLVATGGVIWESLGRIRSPDVVDAPVVMIIAAIGVAVNGISALLFFRGKDNDINIRGAFLHLAADAAVSLGVVISGLIILKTGWEWIDPVTSILVSFIVLGSTWSLFKDSLNLSLDAVPNHINIDKVREFISSRPGVVGIHDLHIWAVSSTEVALTVHVEMPWREDTPTLLVELGAVLDRDYGISHTTVQIEPDQIALNCKQAPEASL